MPLSNNLGDHANMILIDPHSRSWAKSMDTLWDDIKNQSKFCNCSLNKNKTNGLTIWFKSVIFWLEYYFTVHHIFDILI